MKITKFTMLLLTLVSTNAHAWLSCSFDSLGANAGKCVCDTATGHYVMKYNILCANGGTFQMDRSIQPHPELGDANMGKPGYEFISKTLKTVEKKKAVNLIHSSEIGTVNEGGSCAFGSDCKAGLGCVRNICAKEQ